MSNFTELSAKKTSDKAAVARAFSTAAKTYDSAAFLQREIGQRLIQRLDFLHQSISLPLQEEQPLTSTVNGDRLEQAASWLSSEDLQTQENAYSPNTLLDLGSGTGFFSRVLAQKFSDAHIINLDLSLQMLLEAKRLQMPLDTVFNDAVSLCNNTENHSYLCADAESVPLKSNIIDLIFSNCTLQWCRDYLRLFTSLQQLLKPSGAFFFSTFGPDTLIELRESFKQVDDDVHVNEFTDMHPIGDALLKAQFSYPVVDREVITLHYSSVMHLLRDLKSMGANLVQKNVQTGLMTPQKLNNLIAAYESFRNKDGMLPASFEVIYGYAVKSNESTKSGCF